jgi:hypothetical protein
MVDLNIPRVFVLKCTKIVTQLTQTRETAIAQPEKEVAPRGMFRTLLEH